VPDERTGLANRRRFQELIAREVELVRRYHPPIGLIRLDIDDFKSVNDTYGHQQGDLVRRRVARVLADTSREADFPARYGGEELAVILPHTEIEGAYAIAEGERITTPAFLRQGEWIEERIEEILRSKQRLFDEIVDDVSIDLRTALTSEELFGLFGLTPPQDVRV